MKQFIGEWSNIPQEAFLYFPKGEQIIIGEKEKQWRKIFQGGQQYTPYENDTLSQLQKELASQKIVLDPWFDRQNRLRFLQANKFKISKAIQSMSETTKWRRTSFPVQQTPAVLKHLISGALYFCGRDNQYRPILVADIGKFRSDDDEDQSIPGALVTMMEFMINNLLIEGQVENYVLIMNLEAASFSYKNVIMKILNFTSNSYRGRLFVSYILSMPTVIRWGWDAIVSKFVSQNTLKKLKITGDPSNDEMWTHINKETIQAQYGGKMATFTGDFWPPNKKRLLFVSPQSSKENKVISVQQYKQLFAQKKLINRKILSRFIQNLQTAKETVKIQSIVPSYLKSQQKQLKTENQIQQTIPVRSFMIKQSRLREDIVIKTQTSFKPHFKTIKTFFQSDSFQRICQTTVN